MKTHCFVMMVVAGVAAGVNVTNVAGAQSWVPQKNVELVVRALNSLQNCMMFKPCCPSAGPTGGAGLALPAGHWSLMSAVTFFMTLTYARANGSCRDRGGRLMPSRPE